MLVYEQADTSGVEPHYIADPSHPAVKPNEFRLSAGRYAQCEGAVRADPPRRWCHHLDRIDQAAFPYVGRVVWQKHAKLTLVVQNRAETVEKVLAVDPASGAAQTLLTETDPAWLELTASHGIAGRDLPVWAAGWVRLRVGGRAQPAMAAGAASCRWQPGPHDHAARLPV